VDAVIIFNITWNYRQDPIETEKNFARRILAIVVCCIILHSFSILLDIWLVVKVVVHAKSSWLLSGLQVIGKRDFPLPIRMPLFIFFFFLWVLCKYTWVSWAGLWFTCTCVFHRTRRLAMEWGNSYLNVWNALLVSVYANVSCTIHANKSPVFPLLYNTISIEFLSVRRITMKMESFLSLSSLT